MNLRNHVQLIGNLGKNPDIITTPNGKKLARFSVATTEYLKENGELKPKTYWHNIVAWEKAAEVVTQKCVKGTEVVINGKLVNRVYQDKNGEKKYITEIIVNEIICRPNKVSI